MSEPTEEMVAYAKEVWAELRAALDAAETERDELRAEVERLRALSDAELRRAQDG